jgi:hypothetical protein
MFIELCDDPRNRNNNIVVSLDSYFNLSTQGSYKLKRCYEMCM